MSDRTRIVFVAGPPSHAPGAHEHSAGCLLLAKLLNENVDSVETAVHENGWPENSSVFEGADAIVLYCDGGEGHPIRDHLEHVDSLMKEGVGLACLHYAVMPPEGAAEDYFLDWIGGYYQVNWSVNPHWDAELKSFPEHPVTRGVRPFTMNDEWYYHMRFREGMAGVAPVMSALPPASSLEREDGPHSGNPHVRRAVAAGELQHLAWAAERADGGRGFGFTGGHFHDNWAHEELRRFILNAILWTAKLEVPEGGLTTPTPTPEEMAENLAE